MLYPEAQRLYIQAGWTTNFNILPVKGKSQDLPVGFTGYTTNAATSQQYELWAKMKPEYNITLALLADSEFVLFDVDTDSAKGKQGYAQWFEFWDSLGIDCAEIDAQCWISSSRSNPSARGQRLVRVPKGLEWPSKLDADIEIIRYGHRHAVVYPSIHPETGSQYEWYKPGDLNSPSERIPSPEDVVFTLPAEAVKKITGGLKRQERPARKDMAWTDVSEWLLNRADAEGILCQEMTAQLTRAKDFILNRHSYGLDVHHAALKGTDSLIHLAHEGHSGSVTALHELFEVFSSVSATRDSDPSLHTDEWKRLIEGSVAKKQGESDKSCWCGMTLGQKNNVEGEPAAKLESDDLGWGGVDLSAVLSDDYEPLKPTMFTCVNLEELSLIYPGKSHSIFGPSGDGKTLMITAGIAQELIRGRSVLFLDFEDAEDVVVKDRLSGTFGVPDEILLDKSKFLYVRPEGKPSPGSLSAMAFASIALKGWDLVVIDAVTEAMSVWGLRLGGDSDGGAGKIADFNKELVKPFTNNGSAVILVDHTKKEDSGGFALGSQHKRSILTGAAFEVFSTTAFGKGVKGSARLKECKDRPAGLRKYEDKDRFIAIFTLDGRDPENIRYGFESIKAQPTIDFTAVPDTEEAKEAKIKDFLTYNPGASKNKILEQLSGDRNTNSKLVDALKTSGYVYVQSAARGRAARCYWVDVETGVIIGHPDNEVE